MTLDELYRLLRSSHVQAQGIVDTLQEPLVVLDKGFVVINANPAFFKTFKSEREDTLGKSLFDLGNGQWDIPDLRTLLAEVVPKATAIVGYRVAHDFLDLGPRAMLVSARQLSHPDGTSSQMLVVFEDVTKQEKADAAKDILLAETRHRMKNLMAMVRAVAIQTKAEGRTGAEYRDNFLGRFEALLGAQEFINENGPDADLAGLTDRTLRPIAGPRVIVAPSPTVSLTQHQVVPVSMVLHELATNALKYGALSNTDGTINIGWGTEQRDGTEHLLLEWREAGGPPVSPPARQGFGTKLIAFSCKAEGGDAVLEFVPTGLRVQITLPLGQ